MRFAPLFLLLAACGRPPPGESADGAAVAAPGEPDDRIECRVGGMSGFERTCSVESAGDAGDRALTIRYPDGGFRRLRVTAAGVVAADGAVPANVTALDDNRIEVEIGGDRFRLPK